MPQYNPTNTNRQKPDLQYLFYPNDEDALCRMAEEGLNKRIAAKAHTGIVLTNSIAHADFRRIEKEWMDNADFESLSSVGLGTIMICKVYLGKTNRLAQDDEDASPRSRGHIGLSDIAPALKRNHIKYDSVTEEVKPLTEESEDCPFKVKPCAWHVFDNHMIIPEYMVTYDYVRNRAEESDEKGEIDTSFNEVLPTKGSFVGLQDPLVDFLANWKEIKQRPDETSDSLKRDFEKLQGNIHNPLMDDGHVPDSNEDFTLATLNLHDHDIKQIQNLAPYKSLKVLVLSFNKIQKMEGLSSLLTLERLDLGYNQIQKVEGLTGLTNLIHLELQGNLFSDLNSLVSLEVDCAQLTYLDLRSNPNLSKTKQFRGQMLRMLPSLVLLDGVKLSEHDRDQSMLTQTALTDQLIEEHSYIDRDTASFLATGKSRDLTTRKPSRPLLSSSSTRLKISELLKDPANQGLDWQERVIEVELNHQRLNSIQNMQRLTNLRKASFCDNELVDICGLENNTLLEELCLEENRISKINNLGLLTNLTKLDMGKNKLTKIVGLSTLTRLTQLSLEDNNISSVAGLEQLSSLMELYIGNNRISDLKEVQYLKQLPKLLILDMAGNDVCREDNYRLFFIYNLKKLKVLDGIGIDSPEQSHAKEAYSGKLTEELLSEILGHDYYKHLENVDLSNNRIRMAEIIAVDRFPALRVLVLDSNNISDFKHFSPLPLLRVLRLNKNKISGGALDNRGRGHLGVCFPQLEVLPSRCSYLSSFFHKHS